MLTIKNVNASVAKTYFEKGYYENGRWFGQGAAQLNLTGEIKDLTAYNNLLDGHSPDGTQRLMGKKVEAKKHRAAIDCTFNAPKSVSLTALVAGDDRLIEAHRVAVNKTLELMESRYAHTRVLKKGQPRRVINTSSLVISQFDHIETRDLDPHLHTHCVVMNVTPDEDGKWRSLHNDAIYRQQKLLGMVYQHNLANNVQKLGYQVMSNGKGQFEMAGYAQKDLEQFSKRRQRILAEVGENSTVEQRNIAWSNTRVKKEVVPPEELKAKWKKEAQELGITFVTPSQTPRESTSSRGQKSITDAIAHCEERTVAFRQEDLEKFLLDEAQPIDISTLDLEIANHPELIKISEPTQTRYTTQKALARELATIGLMRKGKGTEVEILSEREISTTLQSISLTEGQYEGIKTALTTTDKIIAWQGVAGAGKTYALSHFTQIAQRQGYVIKGFAPSAEAAKVLGDEVGIETNTVASLLCSKSPNKTEAKLLWVVDEAGLLSASAAHDLLQRANNEKARVLLVGDTRQLSAVEAGNPFKSLQATGMTTAFLNQSLRQRTPQLQIAVDLIAKGDIETGFARLDEAECLVEVTEEEKIKTIVADYLKLSPAEREKTLVLSGTNAERLAITGGIRQGLKKEGLLGESANIIQLKSKDLTKVQMSYTHLLEIGDVVMPVFDYKKRRLKKGQLYEVIDKNADTLTIKDEKGNKFTVDPAFEKAVYERLTIEIATGDLLKWTKNNQEKGRRNGQTFKVKAIEGTTARVEYKDGQLDTINLSEPQHLDYGLVSTTYSSQGKTAERVLMSADNTIGKESFYVAVSRVKYDLKLYTTDKDNLLFLALSTRAKENPLELLKKQEIISSFQTTTHESGAELDAPLREGKEDLPLSSLEKPTVVTPEKKEDNPSILFPSAQKQLTTSTDNSQIKETKKIKDASQTLGAEIDSDQHSVKIKEQKSTQTPSNTSSNILDENKRLSDMANLLAITNILRLMEFLSEKVKIKGNWKELEGQKYIFRVSTDKETIEMYAKDGRGLILQRNDGKISGNLDTFDRERMEQLAAQLDKHTSFQKESNQQIKKQQQNRGFSL